MQHRAIHLPQWYMLLLPLLVLFISSCENDLNKVKEIASDEKSTVVEQTTGVDMIVSDSAKVQLQITAPLILQYKTKKPYKVAPKGIKIVFYDKVTLKESGNIIADTGIMRETEKLFEFHKNVVATNIKGETYKSDELYWDQVTKKVYSNKPVVITLNGGNVMNGDGFESDDKFLRPTLKHSKGLFHVTDSLTQ